MSTAVRLHEELRVEHLGTGRDIKRNAKFVVARTARRFGRLPGWLAWRLAVTGWRDGRSNESVTGQLTGWLTGCSAGWLAENYF